MDFTNDLNKIKELVNKSQDILIVSHENPTHESVGSMLALYQGLSTQGKKVTLVCPDPMTVELSSYVGVDKISTENAKKNFIISLDYIDGSIEKVSYNIEGDKFNLVIEPRAGFDTFTEDKVHFRGSNAKVDLIIAIDTIHLGSLKKIIDTESEVYKNLPVINIDRHPNNAHFGQINLVDATVSTTIELVALVLNYLEIGLSEDMATNILNTLYNSTGNFQSSGVTSKTFDIASVCIKAGGKRFTKSITANEILTDIKKTIPDNEDQQVTESVTPRFSKDKPAKTESINEPKNTAVKPSEAPADWLKPKIFKSSGNV
jgi:bifunctional oligoribonuclease and PAP phosphatase NrnA